MSQNNAFFTDPDEFGRMGPRVARGANETDKQLRHRVRLGIKDGDDGEGTDGDTLKRVQAYLVSRGLPSFRQLDLHVHKGVLHIYGETRSQFERQLLLQSVRRISGVKDVIADVTVKGDGGRVGEDEFADEQVDESPAWWQMLPSPGVLTAITVLVCLVGAHFLLRPTKYEYVAPVDKFVTGKFLFGGAPAPGASLTFYPDVSDIPESDDGESSVPSRVVANVGADGVFKISERGLPIGKPREYTVTAQWHQLVDNGSDFDPGPNVIPNKYGDPRSSTLRVELAKGKADVGTLEIK